VVLSKEQKDILDELARRLGQSESETSRGFDGLCKRAWLDRGADSLERKERSAFLMVWIIRCFDLDLNSELDQSGLDLKAIRDAFI
jgi:hypothetical protein